MKRVARTEHHPWVRSISCARCGCGAWSRPCSSGGVSGVCQNRAAAWQRFFDPHLLEHLLVGEKKRRLLRPIHLTLVLWILCALALAGPSWEREPSPFADDQAGLVVLMKASTTMDATDVQPSRLERSKHKLRDLLELQRGRLHRAHRL